MVFDYWSARIGDVDVDFGVVVSITNYERQSIEQRVRPGLVKRPHDAVMVNFTGSRLFGNLMPDGRWKVGGRA